ncbi:RNA-binding protein 45 isoform X2 [Anolis carolinensis]|uniref:RNA-binding protein 45 isoform X2 n=1 Tax=Anolis carolinensis TaxID=28377 RepID=UPI0002C88A50|nr:PREDICTED: RNA-binding protein 45 [Anolis carolinensis]|eukprot:XP_008116425.1 PREDICTED: RNA-binding protein 45 [Anolis carolinensis]
MFASVNKDKFSERWSEPADLERRDARSQAFVSRRLSVESQLPVAQAQLFHLFHLIPGLESCEAHQSVYNNHSYAVVQYSRIASAIYAKQKLHGFEFSFGNRLAISFIEDGTDQTDLAKERAKHLVTSKLLSKIENSNSPLQHLGSNESQSSFRLETDAELPLSKKRKAPPDSYVRERLFILFDPCPLPQDILDNVLSRFGNFINAYIIPGENVAYAMFADRANAADAIATLHGKTVNEVKLKVILTDLPTEDSNKRQRMF